MSKHPSVDQHPQKQWTTNLNLKTIGVRVRGIASINNGYRCCLASKTVTITVYIPVPMVHRMTFRLIDSQILSLIDIVQNMIDFFDFQCDLGGIAFVLN